MPASCIGQSGPTTPPVRPVCYEPTPEEIAAACAAIQREWTPRERAIRAGRAIIPSHGPAGNRLTRSTTNLRIRWEVPVCRLRGMGVAE